MSRHCKSDYTPTVALHCHVQPSSDFIMQACTRTCECVLLLAFPQLS